MSVETNAIEKAKVSKEQKKILLAKAVKEGLILAVNKVRSNNKLGELFHFDEIAETFIRLSVEQKFKNIDNVRVMWASTDTIFAVAHVEIDVGKTMYSIRVTINFSAHGIAYAEIKTYRLVDSTTERV